MARTAYKISPEWTARNAESIRQEFERIYRLFDKFGLGSGSVGFDELLAASQVSILLGRGSDFSVGPFEEITLGGGLTMVDTVLTGGDVEGPASSDDGDLVLFDGTTGKAIKSASQTPAELQAAAVAAAEASILPIDLNSSDVENRLPLNKFIEAGAAERLLGRGAGFGGGSYQEITIGTGVQITSNVLSATNNGDVVGPASATDNALARFDATTGKLLQNSTATLSDAGLLAGVTFANTGLHLLDTNASHDLILAPGSNLTADRTLTLVTGDAARTVTLSGNPTLADWFDQSVKTTASPTFAGLAVNNTNPAITVTGSDTNNAGTVAVAAPTGIGGFIRAYGSSFTVASLAGTFGFGPDGAAGLVIFSNASAASGGSGYISLRGGGYDTAAEKLYIDQNGSQFTGSIGIGKAPTATSPLCISGLPTSASGLATGDVWVDTAGGNILKIV